MNEILWRFGSLRFAVVESRRMTRPNQLPGYIITGTRSWKGLHDINHPACEVHQSLFQVILTAFHLSLCKARRLLDISLED